MDCAGGHLASGDVDGSYCNNGGCHGCEAVRGIEAGAEAASNEILEEMKMDPSGGNHKEAHGQIV